MAFAVGDRVRRVKDHHGGMKPGDEATVLSVQGNGDICVDFSDQCRDYKHSFGNFELVNPRFKVGDQVRCIESPVSSKIDQYVGQILTIKSVSKNDNHVEENSFLYNDSWLEPTPYHLASKYPMYSTFTNITPGTIITREVFDKMRGMVPNSGFVNLEGDTASGTYTTTDTGSYTSFYDQGYTGNWIYSVGNNNNKPKTFMQKLTSTLKRVLNSDLQAQYKAGFLNGDLELTSCGTNALLRLIAADYEAKLGAVAQEVVDEMEKENN